MAEPDDLTVKHILETYFRVEDLQKVLKAFSLPFVGRKPELFQRVLSLINHRQYELDFISKVKTKIVQILRLRTGSELNELMAPTVATTERRAQKSGKNSKSKPKTPFRKRYESDDSYSQSSAEVSEEDESEFIASEDSTDSDKQIEEPKEGKKKRKRVIDPKNSSSSDSSSSSSEDSSDDSSKILNDYSEKTRSERRIEKLMKRKENKYKKLKQKTNEKRKKAKVAKVYHSSSSESEEENRSEELDSDGSFAKKRKTRRKAKKLPINVILSSSDSEPQNNANNEESSDEKEDESDEEIQFIEFVPASQSTIVRTNHFRTKESSSSDTESSAENQMSGSDMDLEITGLETTRTILRKELEKLVTNDSNPVSCVTSSAQKAPEVQTQEIDSQNLNRNITENSEPMDENSNELQVLDITNVESNATIDRSSDVTSNQVNDIIVTNSTNVLQIQTMPTPVVEPKAAEVPPQPKPVVAAPEPPPKPVGPPPPPQPQLPSFCLDLMQIKTPNKAPAKRSYVYTNGVQKVIEPPPPLPERINFQVINANATLKKIKKRLNVSSDEIEAIDQDLKVSLHCPISNLRISIPSRSTQCHHIDCFDINNFIEINYYKRIDDWKCPKCRQSAKVEQLVIDSLIKHILSTTDPSVETVIFDKRAIWTPDVKKVDNFVNTNNSNLINIDNTLEEVIELESDDDEPIPQSMPPLPSMPTNSNLLNKIAAQIASARTTAESASNVLLNNRQQTGEQGVPQRIHMMTTTSAHPQLPNRPPMQITLNMLGLQRPLQTHLLNAAHQPVVTTSAPTNRPPNPNSNPNPTPNRNQRVNLSGDLKFEFNSSGICAIFCKICNENLKLGTNSETSIKDHVIGLKHKQLLAKSKGQTVSQVSGQTVPQMSGNNISRQISARNPSALHSSNTTYTRHPNSNNYYPQFNATTAHTTTHYNANQYQVPNSWPQPTHQTFQPNAQYYQNYNNNNQMYPRMTIPPVPSHMQSNVVPPPAHQPVAQYGHQMAPHLGSNQYTANQNTNAYTHYTNNYS